MTPKEFFTKHGIRLTVQEVIDGLELAKKRCVTFESLYGFPEVKPNAFLAVEAPECSICRRRHGLEILHECE